MDSLTATKRRVELCVGCPDMLEGIPLQTPKDLPHHTECYFINFVDVEDEEEGSHSGFTAQTVCLCTLASASTAWLQGGTEQEVQAIMEQHRSEDHGPTTAN